MEEFVDILTRAQQGEQAALESIILLFGNDVRFICREFQLERLADLSRSDLLQDAWIKIWAQIERFQITGNADDVRNQFRAWLRLVARNEMCRVLEMRQAKKRSPSQPSFGIDEVIKIEDEVDTPSQQFARAYELGQLETAIQQMSEEGQVMVKGCFFEGRSVREMADELNLSYSAARHRLAAALAELKRQLGPN